VVQTTGSKKSVLDPAGAAETITLKIALRIPPRRDRRTVVLSTQLRWPEPDFLCWKWHCNAERDGWMASLSILAPLPGRESFLSGSGGERHRL